MTRNVRKDIFINALACLTLGWMIRNEEPEVQRAPTLGEKFRMEQGADIGRRAREVFPGGVMVDGPWKSALELTTDLLRDKKTNDMFEASFSTGGYSTKADVLRRVPGGWHLVEVKSATNFKDPDHLADMAYTTMVTSRCGVKVKSVSLMLVSKDYRLGMDDRKLFAEEDYTDEVLEYVGKFEPLWEQIEAQTRGRKPDPELSFRCRSCPIFEECTGADIENHVFDLPRLSEQKFQTMSKVGVTRIGDIPEGFTLTPKQKVVRQCVRSGKPWVGDNLARELTHVKWPVHYLDFENISTAVPLYPDVAPYEKIPTQYSIHIRAQPGADLRHRDFLADPGMDCRRELAKRLIRDLGREGNIVTYGTHETTLIKGLKASFPDLSSDLERLEGRVVNLNSILARNFYHPEFHGSTSMKVVLPVLVPKLSYDDLEIQDGDDAAATFVYMTWGRIKGEEAEHAKKNLREYCKRDTLALVRVHEQLNGYCNSTRAQTSLKEF